MTVSAAFLVLDPPLDRLAALLELIRPVVHEAIVVVDDRTRPETVDVMSTWPNVKLIPFGWVDDFAAARNAALPHCTGDWVLHLDPDEIPSRAMLSMRSSWWSNSFRGFVADGRIWSTGIWLIWFMCVTL